VRRRLAAFLLLALAACGKAGPPLPPLRLVPGPVTELTARRAGDEVRFTFVVPTTNANGSGTVNIARIDVFAATVAPGAVAPPSREFMNAKHSVASITVRPPARSGAPAADALPNDPRPAPGERVTLIDKLDASKLQPEFTTMAPVVPTPATPTPTPAAATESTPPVARRLYVIVGSTPSGRLGQPAARIEMPLVDLPAAPTGVAAKFSESSLTLSWTAPAGEIKPPLVFNVYAADAAAPLNPTPLTEPVFERSSIEFGKEECFVVRSVRVAGVVQVESAASDRFCVTPTDTFPPAAPKGLAAVGRGGVVSLIWDANTEADLAGYLVLRGEVPGDTLQPLTPAPIKETTFRDTTAKPGVRYVYAIVAVDTAKNTSPQSLRVEETAR
jgi:hypothetical protein